MSAQADIATRNSMGRNGLIHITDTTLHTGSYSALQVTGAAVFASITGAAGTTISGTWSGTTLPVGFVIPSRIASFQLVSGSVIAYTECAL